MKKAIRIFVLSLCCVMLTAVLASCGKKNEAITVDAGTFVKTEETTNFVCIEMDSGDQIVLELYPGKAPITVQNFQRLVGENFYDGLKFHRVSKNFVFQGGDPAGNGMGGPGWTIKGEFSANGVENDLSHERGVLSMARTALSYDSAGSQFFICLSTPTCAQLNGQYAAFGRVIAGMDTVDEIASVRAFSETPVEDQIMKEVYFVTKLEETEETQQPTQDLTQEIAQGE